MSGYGRTVYRLLTVNNMETDNGHVSTAFGNALIRNAEEIQRRFEEHYRLLCAAASTNCVAEKENTCFCRDCPYRQKFKETLVNTIETLEGTRKAFKSKQIEALRKQLTDILAKEI